MKIYKLLTIFLLLILASGCDKLDYSKNNKTLTPFKDATAIQVIEVSDIDNFGKKLLNKGVRVEACIKIIKECQYNEGYYCAELSEVKNNQCERNSRGVAVALLRDAKFSIAEIKNMTNINKPAMFVGKISMGKGAAGILDSTKVDAPVFIVDELEFQVN